MFKGQFCQIQCFWLAVFSFKTLNMSYNSFLDCMVSAERSGDYYLGSFYVMSCFCIASFKVFSLPLDNLILICLGVDFFRYLVCI